MSTELLGFTSFSSSVIMGATCSCNGKLSKVGNISTHPTYATALLQKKTILTPTSESATQKLVAFYEEEKKHIPKKIDVYYQSVMKEEHLSTTSIIVKVSHLGPRGIEYLCRILPFYSTILELRLWKVGLDPASTDRLAYYLPFLTRLQVLSLEDNSISDAAVANFCKGFKTMRVLRQLWLGCNLLTVKGAVVLSEGLRLLVLLETLSLDYNDIQSAGCDAICKVLCETNKLKRLSMEANAITKEALHELAALAQANAPEHMINLKSNKLDVEACQRCVELFGAEHVDVTYQL